MPLLRGELNVSDFTAQAIILNLETDTRGNSNWDFNFADKSDVIKQPAPLQARQKNREYFILRHWVI